MSVVSRRRLFGLGAFAATGLMAPRAFAALPSRERSLGFHNLHTGENYRGVYWADGAYLPDAMADLRYFLRDFRTGDQHDIDRHLLDLLVLLRGQLDTREPFQVISGYRSPRTNAMLHAEGHGVATHSLHMVGKAIDIRVAGRSLASLRDAALRLRGGGVGYYPRSDFVHVDVGRVRHW